jgi:pimeloyl-ACP methyl ester carboxylesterase
MPYLDIENTTLHYEDDGTGRPLLFLHGWGTSARVWGAQLPEFVRDHRVVTLDWRGCGRSGQPSTGNNVDGVVADLAALVHALRLDHPVVVGSSIGATFAIELALRHPDLVGGVVSVNGPLYWPSTGMDIDTIITDLRDNRAPTVAAWVVNWYAPGTSQALVDWTVRQILDSGVHIDEQFVGAATYDPRPALPDLRVPIHYVHGELDAEIPLSVPTECAALTPGAGVTGIAGAGHLPQQERPAEFNTALRAALATMPVHADVSA